ncbi:MAG: ribose-phosphate diphosphokinase [Aigarchaeota archaeon]|nr:ribose-phosphate diphosphokinase [Aigarchaeota archaeon]MCX8193377.1 ribose-phosphate diphosphokinase [Nitrososphaeria archaeon]MDW7985907.1 ribose-phosphate diphosphokinase [Nitrososphaerota archaeon]
MKLIAGPASTEIAYKMASIMNENLIKIDHKLFPDSENYIRVPEKVEGEDVVIIQGTHPPQDRHLIQIFLMVDTLLDLGARSVKLVAPYLAYTRQDKRFLDGEAISFKIFLKILHKLKVEKIYTVNIHCPWIIPESPIPIVDVRGEIPLARYLQLNKLNNPVVVSVGKKGVEMAKMVAEALGVRYTAAQSERDRLTGKVRVELDGLPGSEAIIVDDMISTGGTMIELIKILKSRGFKKIYATCIHGLLIGDSAERIFNAGAEKIIASDTIPNRYAEYSVAEILVKALKNNND